MSKSQRAGNLDIEQVSAKSTPVRGFCLAKRNDGPEAMKEDGRNEDCPGNPAGKNTMRPRFSPKTDCSEHNTSNPAWGNPMPSVDSPPKEK